MELTTLIIIAAIVVSIILIIVLVALPAAKKAADERRAYLQDLDNRGLKEQCVIDHYNDYFTYIPVNGVMIPQYHHDPVYKCSVVPK